jgi:RNA polymerase sigma-70 factor, ECF subfamily
MIAVEIDKVKKAIKGNKNAFSDLVEERKRDLFRLSFIYVNQENDAMDLFHDTVCKAYSSIRNLKQPEYFNTWIIKININCCMDFLKKRKRISENEMQYIDSVDINQIQDDNYDLADVLSSNIDLLKAVDKLNINLKTIILLMYFQDLTIIQISEILSLPAGTIKSRLNRALGLLRLELKGYNKEVMINEQLKKTM